jgi:hypothetical protein
MAIAVRAGIALQAIAGLTCNGIKLRTMYAVAQLEEAMRSRSHCSQGCGPEAVVELTCLLHLLAVR